MCKHEDIELIAEMRYNNGKEVVEIYTCIECRKTLVKNGRRKPVVFDPKYLQLLYTM